jgi:hypothetical protein
MDMDNFTNSDFTILTVYSKSAAAAANINIITRADIQSYLTE